MTPRTVLVTGGSRGIGLACARSFAAAGHRVAATFASSPLDEPGLLAVRCDVTDPSQIDAAVSTVESELGRVEVLVSNAGITRDGLLVRMPDDDFRDVLDTNLTAGWRLAKRVVPGMMRSRWGRLVFVSSVTAFLGGPGQSNYAAAKAGLVGLARSVAREYSGRGITANVVVPGPIDTHMLQALPPDRREALAAQVPVGRLGTPDEVAAAIRYLASEEAAYVTGALIPVDGGLSMGL
jgi:3-oxoacyl-[acyl-carrier protein] reductase